MAFSGRRYGDSPGDSPPGNAKGLRLIQIGYWEYVPVGDPVGWWERDLDRDEAVALRARQKAFITTFVSTAYGCR
jgi:hypothetical protein